MAYEDFTSYTESDPNSCITVTSSKVSVASAQKKYDQTYVYDDKGLDHFGATFTHEYKDTWSNFQQNELICVHGVANTVDDFTGWSEALFHQHRTYGPGQRLYVLTSKGVGSDESSSQAFGGEHYITLERTSETTAELRAYSDAEKTSLEETLSVNVTDGRRFRYVFVCNTEDHSWATYSSTFDLENLDLNEAGGGTVEAALSLSVVSSLLSSAQAVAEGNNSLPVTASVAPAADAIAEGNSSFPVTASIAPAADAIADAAAVVDVVNAITSTTNAEAEVSFSIAPSVSTLVDADSLAEGGFGLGHLVGLATIAQAVMECGLTMDSVHSLHVYGEGRISVVIVSEGRMVTVHLQDRHPEVSFEDRHPEVSFEDRHPEVE